MDEFLRSYYKPRGRAAFYAAARNIYLDAPLGDDGFWSRLETMEPDSLFVWGRQDTLVPIGFRRHVEDAARRRPRTWSWTAATFPSWRSRAACTPRCAASWRSSR